MNRPAGQTTEVTRALWFRISPRRMFFVCRQVFQCFTLVGVCMCMSAWINERMTEWLFFFRLKTNILFKKNWGMEHEYEQFFWDHFFQIRGPLSQERTWGFRFRWHLWGPQALDNSSIEKENNFFWTILFSNSRSIISGTDQRISVPMTFMRSPGLRQFFYRKRKLIFFGPFFSNSRSIISGTDLRISVPMTFMRSPGLRQFFYRKRKLIFFGPFCFKFAVHYLSNGPEDFDSDDIYEVPRP